MHVGENKMNRVTQRQMEVSLEKEKDAVYKSETLRHQILEQRYKGDRKRMVVNLIACIHSYLDENMGG